MRVFLGGSYRFIPNKETKLHASVYGRVPESQAWGVYGDVGRP